MMRFFLIACLFGLIVACLGCATDRWNRQYSDGLPVNEPLIEDSSESSPGESIADQRFRSWVRQQGDDKRAKDIERRLGVRQ